MNCVTLLVGPIASGKSTWVQQAAALGHVIVNDDAIYAAVHGGDYGRYEHELKLLYKSTENHILTIALAIGRPVVVDRPNIKRLGRARYVGLARAFDTLVEAVVFPRAAPEVHAQRRMDSDPRGQDYAFWLGVAHRHDLGYEEPSMDEGFNHLVVLADNWKDQP